MAEIEIGPLTDRLSDDEIAELARKMEKLGAPPLPRSEAEPATLESDLDDDALTEFYDRLDSHEVAAEIYLPIEFEGSVEVAGMRVASASALLDALEEIRDELDVDEDEDEDLDEDYDEDEDEDYLVAQMKVVWKAFYDGAHAALDRKLPLHVRS